jgi:hypothetical protein
MVVASMLVGAWGAHKLETWQIRKGNRVGIMVWRQNRMSTTGSLISRADLGACGFPIPATLAVGPAC